MEDEPLTAMASGRLRPAWPASATVPVPARPAGLHPPGGHSPPIKIRRRALTDVLGPAYENLTAQSTDDTPD